MTRNALWIIRCVQLLSTEDAAQQIDLAVLKAVFLRQPRQEQLADRLELLRAISSRAVSIEFEVIKISLLILV
jgi:hypothetical protein